MGRKVHLLAWDVLCRPMENGGAGLRWADVMNKAMLAQLGWKLATQAVDAWCKVLSSKYGLSGEGVADFKLMQRSSNTWRGIVWSSELLREGLQ